MTSCLMSSKYELLPDLADLTDGAIEARDDWTFDSVPTAVGLVLDDIVFWDFSVICIGACGVAVPDEGLLPFM